MGTTVTWIKKPFFCVWNFHAAVMENASWTKKVTPWNFIIEKENETW